MYDLELWGDQVEVSEQNFYDTFVGKGCCKVDNTRLSKTFLREG